MPLLHVACGMQVSRISVVRRPSDGPWSVVVAFCLLPSADFASFLTKRRGQQRLLNIPPTSQEKTSAYLFR
jgi:hypothetical protein